MGEGKMTMTEIGIATHEMFLALCAAGFTEEQAIQLVIGMTRPQT